MSPDLDKITQDILKLCQSPDYDENLKQYTLANNNSNTIDDECIEGKSYFICFLVSDYIHHLWDVHLGQCSPKKLSTDTDTTDTYSLTDLLTTEGVFHGYASNNIECHEFVIRVSKDKIHYMSGYGGWYQIIYSVFDKSDWIRRMTNINKLDNESKIKEMVYLFNLPWLIADYVYKGRTLEFKDDDMPEFSRIY